jgi:hypothetical protein
MQEKAWLVVFGGILLCLALGRPLLAVDGTSMMVPGPITGPKQVMAQVSNCTDDSQCQQGYKCQAIMGEGTACPVLLHSTTGSPNPPMPCTSSFRIIQGVCKPAEGIECREEYDCYSGFICHGGVCATPVSGDCSGPDDKSCPAGYTCIQQCGPPVARFPDNTPPGYDCLIEELARRPRICPIR